MLSLKQCHRFEYRMFKHYFDFKLLVGKQRHVWNTNGYCAKPRKHASSHEGQSRDLDYAECISGDKLYGLQHQCSCNALDSYFAVLFFLSVSDMDQMHLNLDDIIRFSGAPDRH